MQTISIPRAESPRTEVFSSLMAGDLPSLVGVLAVLASCPPGRAQTLVGRWEGGLSVPAAPEFEAFPLLVSSWHTAAAPHFDWQVAIGGGSLKLDKPRFLRTSQGLAGVISKSSSGREQRARSPRALLETGHDACRDHSNLRNLDLNRPWQP